MCLITAWHHEDKGRCRITPFVVLPGGNTAFCSRELKSRLLGVVTTKMEAGGSSLCSQAAHRKEKEVTTAFYSDQKKKKSGNASKCPHP